jgi:hypothetical protein
MSSVSLPRAGHKNYAARFVLAILAALAFGDAASAVTRGELLNALFSTGLHYKEMERPLLPRGVPRGHRFAGAIGSAFQYGLISAGPREAGGIFSPDETIDGREAVRLALLMMGWGFEASLCESLAKSGFYGADDPIRSLAGEMYPPAPKRVIAEWDEPLGEAGRYAVMSWVRSCKKSVRWRKEFHCSGVSLLLCRQGTALPGVTRGRTGTPANSAAGGPLYIAAVAASRDEIEASIAFAAAAGRAAAPLFEICEAENAVAAVNGGFFAGERPVGTLLAGGAHGGRSVKGRPAVAWDRGGPLVFGDGSVRVGIRTASRYIPVTRFNAPPLADAVSLYTGITGAWAAGIAADAAVVSVRDGVSTGCAYGAENSDGFFPFPAGRELIAARGRAREALRDVVQGDSLRIISDWADPIFAEKDYMIQAGPLLLLDGTPQVFSDGSAKYGTGFLKKRHPRTIMGTDGDRIFWAVIDGRDPIHSLGATMEETRESAAALGLKSAINLDGGGSSQLVWRGVIANKPSEGRERPLPYAIIVKSNRQDR